MNALNFSQGFDFAMGQMIAYIICAIVMAVIIATPLLCRILWILWRGGRK